MEEIKDAAPSFNPAPGRRKTTCSNCRRRKSKCDSRQPRCSTCIAHKSQCQYDKPPSLAYVRALEARIQELVREKGSNVTGNGVEEGALDQRGPEDDTKSSISCAPPSLDGSQLSGSRERIQVLVKEDALKEINHWVSEISVDGHGDVCYHNPTSAFHEVFPGHQRPSDHQSINKKFSTTTSRREENNPDMEMFKQSLLAYLPTQRRYESMAVDNLAAVQGRVPIPKEKAAEFLKLHWCWIHPMFMFVHRPAFTREMALARPGLPETYFSETLLKVMFAHSSRFTVRSAHGQDPENAFMDTLFEHSQCSLAMGISSPSSIPMIQALLQQSAREVAFGRSSQAWLYSGMAFRMAIDLGIHLPGDKLRTYIKSLTLEDIEIRKRLFWSCYTYDKVISLFLGRMPAFTPPLEGNFPRFLEDFTEYDLWEPYYGSTPQQNGNIKKPYPPQKGRMVSCFTSLCKLSVFLSAIMLEIYGCSTEPRHWPQGCPLSRLPKTPEECEKIKMEAFSNLGPSIRKWFADLPPFLRLTPRKLPEFSPPLHIASLNLLYHTTVILLHRPFIVGQTDLQSHGASKSYHICVEAAAAIRELLELITTTFGFTHISYLDCYSAYIGATIAVLQFQRQQESGQALDITGEDLGLKFFLTCMQRSAVAMPALNRSVDIVKKHMQAIVDSRAKHCMNTLFPTPTDQAREMAPSGTAPDHQMYNTFRPLATAPPQFTQFAQSPAGAVNNTPSLMQPGMPQSYQQYPGFHHQGLPAFPGQNFNVGFDYVLDQEISDPVTRATLLGLDPHLTLQHQHSDWGYDGFYMGDSIQ